MSETINTKASDTGKSATPVIVTAPASSSPPASISLTVTERDDELRDATDEETKQLRHVVDKLPRVVWVSLLVSGAERFTYYAISTPWQNYMQNAPGDSAAPGALGLGQSRATTIFNAYYFFSFLTPVPFALVSDAWIGRYKTLCISLSLYLCGTLVQFVTSLPSVLEREGAGVAGLAVSMFFIGLGVGGTKSTITPFIGDQYPVRAPQVKTLPSGERVIIDRALTLQYVYNVYYWITNVAALSLLASTYLEKERGFWTAHLLALCSSWISLALLIIFSKDFVKFPAQGNVLTQAVKVIGCAVQNRFKLDAARPQYQLKTRNRVVPWTDRFVVEIRSGLRACQVMAWFVLFYLGINQMTNNLVSQAGQMELTSFPNDGIQVLNPIACVILGPFIQKFLYPSLAKLRIPFGPLMRMTMAFFTMAASMAYAAGVQKMIYDSGPCFDHPLACGAARREGQDPLPNSIKVWVQAPVYVILAFSEIFGFVTLSEYSYSKAPKDMRTVVQALRQVTAGVGSALGMALSPVAEDPKLLWMYVGLSVSMGLTAPVFWLVMGHYDKDDKDLNTMFLKEDQEQKKDEETPVSCKEQESKKQ